MSPGNIFAGQGAVIDLGADMDPITARRRFQFVELGETAREPPAAPAPRRTFCSAMPCARPPSCSASQSRFPRQA
jgi:hypothetical protein